jgi:hypothetical protein
MTRPGLFFIDSKQYFLIHAARQSGKTTCIQDLAHQLNAAGHYHALYCSLENAKEFTAPVAEGELLTGLVIHPKPSPSSASKPLLREGRGKPRPYTPVAHPLRVQVR